MTETRRGSAEVVGEICPRGAGGVFTRSSCEQAECLRLEAECAAMRKQLDPTAQ